jgi:hypothetical protein
MPPGRSSVSVQTIDLAGVTAVSLTWLAVAWWLVMTVSPLGSRCVPPAS